VATGAPQAPSASSNKTIAQIRFMQPSPSEKRNNRAPSTTNY